MDSDKMLLEIAQICVDTIPLWEEKEGIALDIMDVWRCPLRVASNLYNEIVNVIEYYAEDNGIDIDDIDPEDVFWEAVRPENKHD